MRTHADIITDAGGPHALAQLIASDVGGDAEVVRKRVWAWFRSGSIPGEYWALLSSKGVETVDTLAAAAEARRLQKGDAAASEAA